MVYEFMVFIVTYSEIFIIPKIGIQINLIWSYKIPK